MAVALTALWWLLACGAPSPEVALWVAGEVAVQPLPLAALDEVAGEGPAVLPLVEAGVAPPSLWLWPGHGEVARHREGKADVALVGLDLDGPPLMLDEHLQRAGGDHQLVLVRGGTGVLQARDDVAGIVRAAQRAEAEVVVFLGEGGAQAVRREGRMVVVYGTGPLWTDELAEPPQALVVELTLGGGKRPRARVRPVRAGGPVLGPQPHPRPETVLDALEVQGSTGWVREAGIASLE